MVPALQLAVGGSVEDARSMAHEVLDGWFDQMLPLFEAGKEVTISDLSRQFSDTRGELLGAVMQAMMEKAYYHHLHQEHAACPDCTRIYKRKRFDKKVLSTLHGELTLDRPYFIVRSAKSGSIPWMMCLPLRLNITNTMFKRRRLS